MHTSITQLSYKFLLFQYRPEKMSTKVSLNLKFVWLLTVLCPWITHRFINRVLMTSRQWNYIFSKGVSSSFSKDYALESQSFFNKCLENQSNIPKRSSSLLISASAVSSSRSGPYLLKCSMPSPPLEFGVRPEPRFHLG